MRTEFETGFGEGEDGATAGRAAAEAALDRLSTHADFAVVFASPDHDVEAVVEGVKAAAGDVGIAGVTAFGEFTERGVHTSAFTGRAGVTVALIASDELRFFSGFGRGVAEDPEAAIAEAAAELPTEVDGYPHRTGLILSSAIYGREELALLAYQELPIEWAGGSSTDASYENPMAFTGEEAGTDAVVLTVIASKRPLALGVGNRHEPIGDPVEVTKAEGGVVHELDGRPAHDVYLEVFDDWARERYGVGVDEIETDPQLRSIAYSEMVFGLRTGEDEYKVRSCHLTPFNEPYASRVDGELDPDNPMGELPTLGTLPEGALQFPYPVPEGVVLYPMASGEQRTIDRGTRSVESALVDLEDGDVAGGLVFDCPCGEVTLQADYPRLVEAIADPIGAPIAGIQSGDEICFKRGDMRGVHETATSVLLFPGGEST